MANVSSNWQDFLDLGLVNRLTRPLHQPGMMKMAMSQRIINRCDRFLNRLPLLSQQIQRWGNTNINTSDAVPIIYAQPVSLAKEQGLGTREHNLQSTVSQNQPSVPIIQRKVDSSQALTVQTDNKTIAFQNSTDLSSSNFSDEATPSLPLETEINQTSTSDSEIPIVSPQSISEELAKTSEMPLPAKFIDSITPSANPSQLNANTPSPSSQDEMTTINQTSTSDSEIPIVSPQSISEELPEGGEMPLFQEFTNTSQQPLAIIQTKPQNSSRSPSSLPVVNPVTSLASPKQTQPDNYSSEKSSSIKYKNLVTPISSTNLPVVTAQPLNAQINLTQEEISFAINLPNYQNQSLHISNPRINQNNNNQSISSLPIVPITYPNNFTSKPQFLPLYVANNSPSTNSINHQPNLLQQNPTLSNTNSSSSPRIFASPSSPTETSVSTMANQSNSKINVDAIANQVERKLMRRLVIESERRGKMR